MSTETKEQPENKQEETPKQEERQVLNQYFSPDTKFELDMKQMSILEQALLPFQWMSAIVADSKNLAASKGKVKSAHKEDFQVDEKGQFLTDSKGQPILRDNFWTEEKKSNSFSITNKGEVETSKSN